MPNLADWDWVSPVVSEFRTCLARLCSTSSTSGWAWGCVWHPESRPVVDHCGRSLCARPTLNILLALSAPLHCQVNPVTRLLIFTTHPIQYQVPWFRALAEAHDLETCVAFSYLPNVHEQGHGFGTPFQWDVPLLTGYRYHVLDTILFSNSLPSFARRWACEIARVIDTFRPDVAMVLGWQEISLVQALIACRRKGIPIILRGESNALKPRSFLTAAVHSSYFHLCDAFLAIGRANADLYRARGVPESKIMVAGYFVDNERFKLAAQSLRSERKALRREWSIPENASCFAFVGKLEPKKRVFDYLELLRRARKTAVHVTGLIVGSGEQLDAARKYVEKCALPVSFTGFLNQTEISRAYVAADALVLPSDYDETWGLVVNEAMASEIPAIVSDRIGAANDLVIDEHTGLVVPFGDTAAMAEGIIRLATDHDARKRMGRDAQLHVTANYSISRAVERTRELIALVLATRNAFA